MLTHKMNIFFSRMATSMFSMPGFSSCVSVL